MFQLAQPVSCEIEIRKSRFLGHLYPVVARSEAKQILAALRARHPDAGHVCWALVCQNDFGLDDDGEPSGTAARPIYNVLVHKELTNVLAAVVRYWGGTKLGAGGLVRAYGQAISDACKLANLTPVERISQRGYIIPFADESAFRRLCDQCGAKIDNADYGLDVRITLRIRDDRLEEFERQASDLLRGTLLTIVT